MTRVSIPAGHGPTPTEWALLLSYAQPLVARKTADESVTSSTTAQNDDQLLLSVEANADYELTTMIIYTADTGGKLAITWTAPAGATLDWIHGSADSTVSATSGITWWGSGTIATSHSIGAAGTGTPCIARPYGILRIGSTAGTLQFKWAQMLSNVNATTVKSGSFIQLRRLA